MDMANAILEKEAKRIIIRLHQEIFGKGPDQLWVKVEQNVCMFSFFKTLTPMENFLLKAKNGLEQVQKLRREILDATNARLCQELELLHEIKILSSTSEISIETDSVHGAILFVWRQHLGTAPKGLDKDPE
ncbi:MAG: Na-translocating system protein MpsC family protein [Bacillota bacterium]